MGKKKTQARTFENMNYRKVQRKNTRNRNLLKIDDQQWLKNNGYKNIGWNNVISLYQKINELQRKEQINNFDLENLFLEADRVGNKYFTEKEIYHKQQIIAQELNQISTIIELQFPDQEIEIIDYSPNKHHLPRKNKKIRIR